MVEYEEEARLGGVRSHEALTYDHSGAIGTWTPSQLSPGHTSSAPLAGIAPASAALQKAG